MIHFKHQKSIIFIILIALTFSSPAYAYLDPGTGSVMVQGLLAGVASTLAVIKLYWQRLKRFFFRLLGKKILLEDKSETSSKEQK